MNQCEVDFTYDSNFWIGSLEGCFFVGGVVKKVTPQQPVVVRGDR